MVRFQLIEIHEQKWCPAIIRNGMRAGLQFVSSVLPGYEVILDDLLEAMEHAGTREVLDLCSGAGGPWRRLEMALGGDSRLERVTLTDLYPDSCSMAQFAEEPGLLTGHGESVDVLSVPKGLKGFRTMFASFHHFRPEEAEQIINSAIDENEGIGIFELTERTWTALAVFALSGVPAALCMMPFVRPFRWAYVPFTYMLPLIPFVATIDGVVSCLRSYNPEELLEIARRTKPGYEWKAGRRRAPWSPFHVTYLIGTPAMKD